MINATFTTGGTMTGIPRPWSAEKRGEPEGSQEESRARHEACKGRLGQGTNSPNTPPNRGMFPTLPFFMEHTAPKGP